MPNHQLQPISAPFKSFLSMTHKKSKKHSSQPQPQPHAFPLTPTMDTKESTSFKSNLHFSCSLNNEKETSNKVSNHFMKLGKRKGSFFMELEQEDALRQDTQSTLLPPTSKLSTCATTAATNTMMMMKTETKHDLDLNPLDPWDWSNSSSSPNLPSLNQTPISPSTPNTKTNTDRLSFGEKSCLNDDERTNTNASDVEEMPHERIPSPMHGPPIESVEDMVQVIQDAQKAISNQLDIITQVFKSTESFKQICLEKMSKAKHQLELQEKELTHLREQKIDQVQSILKLK